MKRSKVVWCNYNLCLLVLKYWESQEIGGYYVCEKNNKIYIPFGNRIEIYDKTDFINRFVGEGNES